MEIENRTELVSEAISLIINSAPISEVLRVYSLALQNELNSMDDVTLSSALVNAGYSTLAEKYNLLGILEDHSEADSELGEYED